jgi:hypothetical protein
MIDKLVIYICKIELEFNLWKNNKLYVLNSLYTIKLVCEVYLPFQWCPLHYIKIEKKTCCSIGPSHLF